MKFIDIIGAILIVIGVAMTVFIFVAARARASGPPHIPQIDLPSVLSMISARLK